MDELSLAAKSTFKPRDEKRSNRLMPSDRLTKIDMRECAVAPVVDDEQHSKIPGECNGFYPFSMRID